MPVNFGNQQYPALPNCFDLLTTHGVIAEDMVGYITDTPSPYLQNYVAQHSQALPIIPGQILPDNMPVLPQPAPLPKNDVYQPSNPQEKIPSQSELTPKTFNKKNKWDKFKKAAAAILLTGLIVFGAVKGKDFAVKIYNKLFRRTPTP